MKRIKERLILDFNDKTQIFPIKHGDEYLGWRLYLTDTGRVVKRLKKNSKVRFQHRLRKLSKQYTHGEIEFQKIGEVLTSYNGHLMHGNTWQLRRKLICDMVLNRAEPIADPYEIRTDNDTDS